jgi:cytochrome c553
MSRVLTALALFAAFATTVSAAGDPAAGKAHYAPCAACHGAGAEGNPALNAPALAGQQAAYLERQLLNFRNGLRGGDPADTAGAQMRGMAAVLPGDQAVADVAAFLASLPMTPAASEASGDLHNGNNFYQGKCGACHGGKAEGNAALNAPRLAGLDVAYLKRQFLAFRDGKRGAAPEDKFGRQMTMMAKTLPTEKDIDDVMAFIHAQHGSATH